MDGWQSMRELESSARTYAATFTTTFVSGAGSRVRDSYGREYIDCLSNAGALAVGHNHPEVREAVARFVSSDHIQQALDLTTPTKVAFVQELFARLPASFRDSAKIHFCGPTGSDAVEAAIKLARYYSKRPTIIAFRGAYHGMTTGALAAMGNAQVKSLTGAAQTGVAFAPFPHRFRCPFGTDGTQTDHLCLKYLETMLADPHSGIPLPAGLLVEVVQGEGGCIPASDEWLRGIREITRVHDIPLIIDEVQTGIGRTGSVFAFERAGITPDVLVLSKAVGGGYPLAVLLYDKRMDGWPSGAHTGTFRGNQIAMVAGQVTMRIVDRDSLADNAARMGQVLQDGLEQVARRFPTLADVRGRGLMLGIEVDTRDAPASWKADDADLARAIKRDCFHNGLILETGGRNDAVIRFLPPLIVNERDVAAILDRFETAVVSAHRRKA